MNRTITVMLLTLAALVGLGTAMLASLTLGSADGPGAASTGAGVNPWLVRQAVACLLGFGGLLAAASLDYRRLEGWVWPVYVLSLVLLGLVLTPSAPLPTGRSAGCWGFSRPSSPSSP